MQKDPEEVITKTNVSSSGKKLSSGNEKTPKRRKDRFSWKFDDVAFIKNNNE
ncbi:hypothetical protein ACQKM9_03280 [Viridibacillus sp. NPDC093762]|uniref:hypothetical protein n=1 Tax=Viridibacillus sp. NPDC093762 TaxID=3390720 RepID=UPI003D04831D